MDAEKIQSFADRKDINKLHGALKSSRTAHFIVQMEVTNSAECGSSIRSVFAWHAIPTSGTFFHGDLVMKTFLRPFSLFRRFKKSSCQLLAKECALRTGKLPRRLA